MKEFLSKINKKLLPLKRFFQNPSYPRTLALIGILILVAIIPITVVVLQQRTQTQQHASELNCWGIKGAVCTTFQICRFNGYQNCRIGYGCTSPNSYCAFNNGACRLVGTQCGVNSDCCFGLYCDRTGTCRNQCAQTQTNGVCYGNYLCDRVNNKANVCGSTDYINCQHVANKCGYCPVGYKPSGTTCVKTDCLNAGGTCYTNNSCGANQHEISKSCSSSTNAGRICCAAGAPTPWYDCKSTGYASVGGQIQKHTTTSVTVVGQCSTNTVCKNPSSRLLFIADSSTAVAQAQKVLCSTSVPPKPNPNAVRCGNNYQGFCYSYERTLAGTGPNCDTSAYTSDSASFCYDSFSTTPSCSTLSHGSVESTVNTSSCSPYHNTRCCIGGSFAPTPSPTPFINSCLKTVGNKCVTNASAGCGTGFVEGSGTCDVNHRALCCTPVLPSCASKGGICYQNNSCGNGNHPIDGVTCTSGTRICCVKDSAPPTTCKALGGTCKTPVIDTLSGGGITVGIGVACPSGSKGATQSVTDCSTNQICCIPVPTSGGGGGGGNGSCVDPNTNATIQQGHECSNKAICVSGSCVGGCAAAGRVCDIPGDVCPAGGGKCVCAGGKTTGFVLSVKLDGIGPGTFENHTPAHTTRNAIYVKVTDKAGAVKYNNTSTVFGHANGKFNNPHVNLGTGLACGATFTVAVKIPRYLPAKASLTYGTDKTLDVDPIVGDINKVDPTTKVIVGDDKIDINDYALVRACHNVDPTTPQTFTTGSTKVTLTCAELMNFFDYADGGTQGDNWAFNYNLWLRGYLKANGL